MDIKELAKFAYPEISDKTTFFFATSLLRDLEIQGEIIVLRKHANIQPDLNGLGFSRCNVTEFYAGYSASLDVCCVYPEMSEYSL
jgi:hypothetical protein